MPKIGAFPLISSILFPKGCLNDLRLECFDEGVDYCPAMISVVNASNGGAIGVEFLSLDLTGKPALLYGAMKQPTAARIERRSGG
ncbi:MAG TPA: hypothetical protein VFX55_21905 [Duganella sp.]|nr:hypothetical protein [Duganella sp.]